MNDLATAVEPSRPLMERPSPEPAAPAILVADDDQEMCELADAGLSRRGYQVTWRLSPEGALECLDQGDYSVLLVDIHMDGMSGLDLCQQALAKRPDLVVIVMTGFGTLDHAI